MVTQYELDSLCDSFSIATSCSAPPDEWELLQENLRKLKYNFNRDLLFVCADSVIRYKYTFGDNIQEYAKGYKNIEDIQKGINNFLENWSMFKKYSSNSNYPGYQDDIEFLRKSLISLFSIMVDSIETYEKELEKDIENFATKMYDSDDENLIECDEL